jgi:phosphoribosylformylglycinamidine (FGAM) synthase-like enzyme
MKVKEIDRTGKEIFCRRCGKPQAILKFDGQVLLVGNVEFYNSVRYSCAGCGFPTTFFASPLKDDTKSLGKDSRRVLIDLGKTKKILNGLGLSQKYNELKEKRRKKVN